MSFLKLTPTEIQPSLDRYTIIDVRESHEFHGPLGRLQNAEPMPLSTIEKSAKHLSGDRPLLLVCRSGKRSGKACETLIELDVCNVTNLEGGMILWNQCGLPIVRTELVSSAELLRSVTVWLAQVSSEGQPAAAGRVDALLHAVGTSSMAPTAAGLDHVLNELGQELRTTGAPPDLEIALDAYRKDLSVL